MKTGTEPQSTIQWEDIGKQHLNISRTEDKINLFFDEKLFLEGKRRCFLRIRVDCKENESPKL
jgi:hypothetical protein